MKQTTFLRGIISNSCGKSLLNVLKTNFCQDGAQTPGQGSKEVVDSNPWRYLKLSWPCSVHGIGQETSRSPVLSLSLCGNAIQRSCCFCSVPASSQPCKLLFLTCHSWCDSHKSHQTEGKKLIEACSYPLNTFANYAVIQRRLFGGACLDCLCCVKSLLCRDGMHIASLSSLRTSCYAGF